MPNYNNGKIYKIVNNIDNMLYIGSTTTKLCQRMNVHRCKTRYNNNINLYNHMRKLGVDNFKIVLIEEYSCSNKDQLLRRERYILELHDKQKLLNSNKPHTTCIEKIYQKRECVKIWYNNNKTYKLNKCKIWRENNKQYNQKYNEHQKLMQELPFYKVKFFMSF
jgi:hypothetical protein